MIRHLIVFNAEESPEAVRTMAEEAKHVLGSIPGVFEVRFGVAMTDKARYRYLFDIGLVDEAALAAYQRDPIHIDFAEGRFRPLAPDRITTDFLLQ
jgi:fructose-bisphosphate aldolase class II